MPVSCHTDNRTPSPAAKVKVCLSTRKSSAKIIHSFWHHRSILAKQQCPCSSPVAALEKLHRVALHSPCLILPYSFKAMGREGSCWLFWVKDRWGCHTHRGTMRLHSWSQWTSPDSGAPLKSLQKRGRDFFGCWVKCHMERGNRSITCGILSLSVPKGAKRGMWLEQAYLLIQFPRFQALSKASVLSAWIVLPFSIPNMFVQTDKYILVVCAYIPIRNMCSAFLLDELVGKIATAASPALHPVTELDNCDHWHYNAI